MFNFFKTKNAQTTVSNQISTDSEFTDFSYLDPSAYYFDSACQTLRPQSVINAEVAYYHNHNSCGHRVKYKWGEQTDKLVEECRENILKLAGKSSKDYTVAFCLNTTHGINTVLHQINNFPEATNSKKKNFDFDSIYVSDIDHNSVFLSSITWSERFADKRLVLERDEIGNLIYEKNELKDSIILTNSMSNIDGRELLNAKKLAEDLHEMGGILLLDACQTLGHNPEFLREVDFDAAFGSGHKMYGPSVGFIIIKKTLLKKLDCYLIGGSTVQDVKLDSFELIENDEEIYARLEPGLQNYAGIIGLNEAIKWRTSWKNEQNHSATEYEHSLALYLNQKLLEIPQIKLLNPHPSSVVSLYSDKIDGHKMAMYLGEAGIMCRSGYHCCHYYLKEKMKFPPLFRISLGLHNNPEEIDYLMEKMKVILG
jgi:selenocysteine lyase/cysteine desulfurase